MYVVIFSSKRRPGTDDYDDLAVRMEELARAQPGFIELESTRGADGFGITVCYWQSLEAIRAWRTHAEHVLAQARGRDKFYERYQVRVCHVEREYSYP